MTDEKEDGPTFRVTDRRGQLKDETPQHATPPKGRSVGPHSIDFSNFVLSLSTSALMHMGYVEDAATGKVTKNIDMARQEIDLIEMLQEKTKGNLTPQEAGMMEEVLYELRLRFVEASR